MASAFAATVAGGARNTSSGRYAAVAGGNLNTASDTYATVGGGNANIARGQFATVPGGVSNVAAGVGSFSAGHSAKALEDGMFVWSDARGSAFVPTDHRAPGQSVNTFNVRATGGVWLVTGTDAGSGLPTWACYTLNGGGWTCSSDRNLKRNLRRLDGEAVLKRLVAMPVYQWQPKDGPNAAVKHIGPTAQDFRAAFGVGDSDKAIGLQDADGVALAAIQGLHALSQRQEKAITALQAELAALRRAQR